MNGLCERGNRRVSDMITDIRNWMEDTKYCDDYNLQVTWDRYLQEEEIHYLEEDDSNEVSI